MAKRQDILRVASRHGPHEARSRFAILALTAIEIAKAAALSILGLCAADHIGISSAPAGQEYREPIR